MLGLFSNPVSDVRFDPLRQLLRRCHLPLMGRKKKDESPDTRRQTPGLIVTIKAPGAPLLRRFAPPRPPVLLRRPRGQDKSTPPYGLRTTDYGLRITDYGLRITDYGLRITDY